MLFAAAKARKTPMGPGQDRRRGWGASPSPKAGEGGGGEPRLATAQGKEVGDCGTNHHLGKNTPLPPWETVV